MMSEVSEDFELESFPRKHSLMWNGYMIAATVSGRDFFIDEDGDSSDGIQSYSLSFDTEKDAREWIHEHIRTKWPQARVVFVNLSANLTELSRLAAADDEIAAEDAALLEHREAQRVG